MANRVSELKDNTKYLTEEDKNVFTFDSHTATSAKAYGMRFSIRKEDGFWQIYDTDQAGQSYWTYLTKASQGGRKSRKRHNNRRHKKATRHLKL